MPTEVPEIQLDDHWLEDLEGDLEPDNGDKNIDTSTSHAQKLFRIKNPQVKNYKITVHRIRSNLRG